MHKASRSLLGDSYFLLFIIKIADYFMSILLIFLISIFVFGNAIAAEKIPLQLRWDHQFQFAGYYAAQWQGYYKDAGFQIEIRSAITHELHTGWKPMLPL